MRILPERPSSCAQPSLSAASSTTSFSKAMNFLLIPGVCLFEELTEGFCFEGLPGTAGAVTLFSEISPTSSSKATGVAVEETTKLDRSEHTLYVVHEYVVHENVGTGEEWENDVTEVSAKMEKNLLHGHQRIHSHCKP